MNSSQSNPHRSFRPRHQEHDSTPKTAGLTFLASLAYAALQANSAAPGHWTLHTLTLGSGLAGAVLVGRALMARGRGERRQLGRWGFNLALFHLLLSISQVDTVLLSNLQQLGFACGLAGTILLAQLFQDGSGQNQGRDRQAGAGTAGRVVLGLLLVHALLLEPDTWTSPGSWPKFLPPVSLIGFLWGLIVWFRWPKHQEREHRPERRSQNSGREQRPERESRPRQQESRDNDRSQRPPRQQSPRPQEPRAEEGHSGSGDGDRTRRPRRRRPRRGGRPGEGGPSGGSSE